MSTASPKRRAENAAAALHSLADALDGLSPHPTLEELRKLAHRRFTAIEALHALARFGGVAPDVAATAETQLRALQRVAATAAELPAPSTLRAWALARSADLG